MEKDKVTTGSMGNMSTASNCGTYNVPTATGNAKCCEKPSYSISSSHTYCTHCGNAKSLPTGNSYFPYWQVPYTGGSPIIT